MSIAAGSSRAPGSSTCATPATRSSSPAATTPPAPTSSCSSTSPRPPTSARPSSSSRAARADDVFIPFTIGGGMRSVADAQAVLDAGADKVSVNSAALARPELIDELAATFGAQCVVLAIDAKRSAGARWEAYVAGGRTPTGRDAVAWAREGSRARGGGDPADEHGPRRHQRRLRPRADGRGRRDALRVPVIASGGAGELDHLAEALARRRRRGPVRLDLPLRPAHGRRGQAAPRGRRDPGAALTTG